MYLQIVNSHKMNLHISLVWTFPLVLDLQSNCPLSQTVFPIAAPLLSNSLRLEKSENNQILPRFHLHRFFYKFSFCLVSCFGFISTVRL